MREKTITELEMSDHIKAHFIAVPEDFKKKLLDQASEPLRRWVLFFGEENYMEGVDMDELAELDAGLAQAVGRYQRCMSDPVQREMALRREKFLRDQATDLYETRNEALEEGIGIGRVREGRKTLLMILNKRLAPLPETFVQKIEQLNNLEEINRLTNLSLDIPSLEEFIDQMKK